MAWGSCPVCGDEYEFDPTKPEPYVADMLCLQCEMDGFDDEQVGVPRERERDIHPASRVAERTGGSPGESPRGLRSEQPRVQDGSDDDDGGAADDGARDDGASYYDGDDYWWLRAHRFDYPIED